MTIDLSNLQEWLDASGISYKDEPDETLIKYTLPEAIYVQLKDITLCFGHRMAVSPSSHYETTLQQSSMIEITPKQPMHYYDYHNKIIGYLKEFFCFGEDIAVVPISLIAINKKIVFKRDTKPDIPISIEIYDAPRGYTLATEKDVSKQDFLFDYKLIENHFQEVLNKWYEVRSKLKPIMDLHLGLKYIPATYLELVFLTLAQALEAYHRRMYKNERYMSKTEYQPIKDILVEAIPKHLDDKHQQSLSDGMSFGYEYSFRKRIKIIINEKLQEHSELVNNIVINKREFINNIVKTRNYYTHYTNDLEKQATIKPEDLYELTQRATLLLQLCILHELELPVDTIEKIMENYQPYRFWTK